MAGKTLRDLVAAREDIDALLLMQEGELNEEVEKLLTDNGAAIEKKVEGIGYHIVAEEMYVEAIDQQIKRLQARKTSIEHRVDWLKNSYLADCLLKLGRDKVVTATVTVAKQLNNPRLDGPEPTPEFLAEAFAAKVPYVKQTIEYKLDRKALLSALQAENPTEFNFGMSVVRDESVRIR